MNTPPVPWTVPVLHDTSEGLYSKVSRPRARQAPLDALVFWRCGNREAVGLAPGEIGRPTALEKGSMTRTVGNEVGKWLHV